MTNIEEVLEEQVRYYRARAPEYDEWHLRVGRYDRGETHRRAWCAELESARAAIEDSRPLGRTLEIACGTGLWTPQLVDAASRLTAVDVSPEAIEINRDKVCSDKVTYIIADIFNWQPCERYDFIFFAFWLSHVPPELFEPFWEFLRNTLSPHGRVFFVDSLAMPQSTAKDHEALGRYGFAQRKLNDGSQYRIVKIFYKPNELEDRLHLLGWDGDVDVTGDFFLHGSMAVSTTSAEPDAEQ